MRLAGKWKWMLSLSLVVVFLTSLHSCLQFRMSTKQIASFFADKKQKGQVLSYKEGFRTIQYVMAGEGDKPLVVFIHGSPGSLSAFIHFLGDSALLQHARLLTMDRPGFGHSNFGNAEPSLKKQAYLMKQVIALHKNNEPVFLVGHSLGGPLIARMAMDYPEMVDGLIMVAPSIDPELEPYEWYRAPLATPMLRWLLPRSFRASNDELYQLKPQLESLLPRWSQITQPTIIIQGKRDRLVPYQNAFFAKEKMTNAPVTTVMVDDMDHFVPWTNPELINAAIFDMISRYDSTVVKK
jgi:pimeloyl-ACP methyl ester carboxylesterase